MNPEAQVRVREGRIQKIEWDKRGVFVKKNFKNSIFLFLIFFTLFIYWKFSHTIVDSMCPGQPSFYKYSICPGKFNLYNGHATGYYTRLTESFLNGQLSFLETPDPSFLQLKDPYDPQFNLESPYRFHDASLYKGKWYIYFGVMPVFLLWLPAKAFGLTMTEPLATTLFCWAGFLASLGFIYNIARANNISIDASHWVIIILLLSFSNDIPIMIKRPFVYEVSISCAYFCFMSSLYFYSFSFLNSYNYKKYILISSLFFSFSILSRISYIIFFSVFFLIEFFCKKNNFYSFLKKQFLFLSFPFLALIIQGFYNYARFESFINFGIEYQIAAIKIKDMNIFSLNNFKSNIYVFFHELVRFFYFKIGLLQLTPFIIFLLSSFLFFKRDFLIKLILILSFAGFIQLFFISILFSGITIRYAIDFIPILLVASILSFIFLRENLGVNLYIFSFAFILTIYGCVTNMMSFPIL